MQKILLAEYDWIVKVFYDVGSQDADEICKELACIGCEERFLSDAERNLSGGLNGGLTYSNMSTRNSVVAIAMASESGELLNTASHEALHVVGHICEYYGIDMHTERACYLMGGLMQSMWNVLKNITTENNG